MYYEQFRDNLFASVPAPPRLGSVLRKIKAWEDFCRLPEEVKQRFAFPNDQNGWDPGYVRRTRAEGRDEKCFYHYLPGNAALVDKNVPVRWLETQPVVRRFFDLAANLHHIIFPLVMKMAEDMQAFIPGIVDHLERGESHFVYRYLYYGTSLTKGQLLADPHHDKGGFTLQIYESEPGLQLLNWDLQWFSPPASSSTLIAFPSWKFEVMTGEEVQNAYHRVVSQQEEPGITNRTSVVLFVPLIDIPSYNEDVRTQDKTPGYKPRKMKAAV